MFTVFAVYPFQYDRAIVNDTITHVNRLTAFLIHCFQQNGNPSQGAGNKDQLQLKTE